MRLGYGILACLCGVLCWYCATPTVSAPPPPVSDVNPAAPGFNAAGSDDAAIAWADKVMVAMGGRAAWDQTRYLSWNFFGARQLLWDKYTGRVRIDVPDQAMVYLIDIDSDGPGRIQQRGKEMTNPDSLAKYTQRGKSIWINDAYWLVMPYKLKDSGVTLEYLGEGRTQADKTAEVLALTFDQVGDTPDNKYHVYIDPASQLISQWDFYTNAADATPRFSTPWQDYRSYGPILLSGDRGERHLTDIAVYTEVPAVAFRDFTPPTREDWPRPR